MLKFVKLGHWRLLFRYVQAPNRTKANVMVLCRKLLHLEKCFAISRHHYLPERVGYLFAVLVLSWEILQGQMLGISSCSNK